MLKEIFVGTWLVFFSGLCISAPIDIDNRLLKLSIGVFFPPCPAGKHCAMLPLPGLPAVINVRVLPLNISVDGVDFNPIPEAINTNKSIHNNCTNDSQKGLDGESIKVTYVEGFSVVITNGITYTNESSLSIPLNVAKIGFNGKAELKDSIQTSNNNQTSKEEFAQLPSIITPPWTSRIFTLEKRVSSGFTKFKGIIVADADFVLKDPRSGKIYPLNKKVSDLVPENERTFDLSGEIWNATAQEKKFTWVDYPIDKLNPPAGCLTKN